MMEQEMIGALVTNLQRFGKEPGKLRSQNMWRSSRLQDY